MVMIEITVPTLTYQRVAIADANIASHPQDEDSNTPAILTNQAIPRATNTGPIEKGLMPNEATILLQTPGSSGPKYLPFLITCIPSNSIHPPFKSANKNKLNSTHCVLLIT